MNIILKRDALKSYEITYKGTDVKKRMRSSYDVRELRDLERQVIEKYKRGGK